MTAPELPTDAVYIFSSLVDPNENYSRVQVSLTLNRPLSFAEHVWLVEQGESLGYEFEFPEAPEATIRSAGFIPTPVAKGHVEHIIRFLAQLPDAAGELHAGLVRNYQELTEIQVAISKAVIEARPQEGA